MNVAFLTLAINEAALNRFLSAVGGLLCGMVAIAVLVVVLIGLVLAGVKQTDAERKKGRVTVKGLSLLGFIVVVVALIVGVVFWARSLVPDVLPTVRPRPAPDVPVAPLSSAALAFPEDIFKNQRKGDWSILWDGGKYVTFVVTKRVDDTLEVAIARVGTASRTFTLERGVRLGYGDLARLGLRACPPISKPESSFMSRSASWRGDKKLEGWSLLIGWEIPNEPYHRVELSLSSEVAFPGIVSVEVDFERFVSLAATGHDDETLLGSKPPNAPWPTSVEPETSGSGPR